MKRAINIEQQYLSVMRDLSTCGEDREDRTGTGTYSKFGVTLEHSDVYATFPLLTTKKVHFNSVAWELLWFLHGSPNVKWLQDKGVTIWDEWADPTGYLGPVYGKQWREWTDSTSPGDPYTIDQIAKLVHDLKHDPYSRRHIVNAWNVAELLYMALPPCHMMFQCYVGQGGYLDLQMYQRSADWFLGVPFNIASYALLMHLLGIAAGLRPRKLRMVFGDAHIYKNHISQVRAQLSRITLPMPRLHVHERVELTDYDADTDFLLIDYKSHPAIPAPISV